MRVRSAQGAWSRSGSGTRAQIRAASRVSALDLGGQLVREDLVRGPPHRRLPVAAPVGRRGREAPVVAEQFAGALPGR